jgi:hypothetical protein
MNDLSLGRETVHIAQRDLSTWMMMLVVIWIYLFVSRDVAIAEECGTSVAWRRDSSLLPVGLADAGMATSTWLSSFGVGLSTYVDIARHIVASLTKEQIYSLVVSHSQGNATLQHESTGPLAVIGIYR